MSVKMGDIVLEMPFNPTTRSNFPFCFATLRNVPGQQYTIGSMYPGVKKKDEFLFFRYGNVVKPVACHITVDRMGGYWIRNALTKGAKTYLNGERLGRDRRRLQLGDSISLQSPRIFEDFVECGRGPVFRVLEKQKHRIPMVPIQEARRPTSKKEAQLKSCDSALYGSNPLDNPLILSTILNYLPATEVKNCRLVSKGWNAEAHKILGKKGFVIFEFSEWYMHPETSSYISRFLSDVKELKIQSIAISTEGTLPPDDPMETSEDDKHRMFYQRPLRTGSGEPGQKIIDDLKMLLRSDNNFRSVSISNCVSNSSDYSIFQMIIQEIAENVKELLLAAFEPSFNPSNSSLQFPVLKSLKSFVHHGGAYQIMVGDMKTAQEKVYKDWAALLVPLFRNSVEDVDFDGGLAEIYIPALIKQKAKKLSGLSVSELTPVGLRSLKQLPNPLTILRLPDMFELTNIQEVAMFEEMLSKNAKTLRILEIDVFSYTEEFEIGLPRFPNLQDLSFSFNRRIKIRWTNHPSKNSVYAENFPVLRKLEVQTHIWKPEGVNGYHIPGPPFVLEEGASDVVNALFPADSEEIVRSVMDLQVPPLRKAGNTKPKYDKYRDRVMKIAKMFPNAELREIKEMNQPVFIAEGGVTLRRSKRLNKSSK